LCGFDLLRGSIAAALSSFPSSVASSFIQTGGSGSGSDTDGGNGGPALNAGESMLLGAVAGGLSAVATHPIDTVKSNMQALGGGAFVVFWVWVWV
jgi:hypothetical protein